MDFPGNLDGERTDCKTNWRPDIAVNLKYVWRTSVRIFLSALSAGVFYSVWMAAFLLVKKLDITLAEYLLWALAPVFTSSGFAAGILMLDRMAGTQTARFLPIFIWPLIGCAVGALVVYWFGPMLIVFGMFVCGSLGIALREMAVRAKSIKNKQNP
jgi:hypothetical protein